MKHSLVVIALLSEGTLVVIALIWQRLRGITLGLGDFWYSVTFGIAVAVAFALVNWYLLCWAPGLRPVTAIRRVYRENLKPTFGGVTVFDAAVISAAAGIGEELLFRGVLQPEVGVVLASGIFGVLHMGGRGSLAFGCLVGVMGAVLGGLAIWTGGLLAPIVAHAAYDAMAISYIRWVPDCSSVEIQNTGRDYMDDRTGY